ncbi:hypothetical protein [Bdellovibrio sp. HCB337]|uniref:hypothetical protein n=1 Tax=Bdellovibrio sp. HCB337 TaxID=3394358 RepID=UPI0039A6B8D3
MKALFLSLALVTLTFAAQARADELCESYGFTGNTVEEAENECLTKGDYITRARCNQDVTCAEGVMVCTTRGYKGSTITLAVEACYDLGYIYSREQCEQDVTCKQ